MFDVFSRMVGRTKGTGALTATSAKDTRTSISAVNAETPRNTSEKDDATSTTRSGVPTNGDLEHPMGLD